MHITTPVASTAPFTTDYYDSIRLSVHDNTNLLVIMRKLQHDRKHVLPQIHRFHKPRHAHQTLPRRLPHLCLAVSQKLGQRRKHGLQAA